MKHYRLFFKLTFYENFKNFHKGEVKYMNYYLSAVDIAFGSAFDKCIESVIEYYQECTFEFLRFEVSDEGF